MTFEEKTLESQRIYEGAVLNLRRDKVTVRDNGTSYREVIEHRGAVTLAAMTAEGNMVLVRQFRYAAGKVLLETPAGKMEKGEEPIVTAARELKEETGYTAGKLTHLSSFYCAIGYSNEIIHLYLAEDLTPGETDFDDNEAIEVEEIPLTELKRMALAGEIDDGKTLVAILTVAARMGI